MFDLFRSRDKAVRIMLGGILVVVSFSMLTYLIPNFNTGTGDPSDMVVAEIGKDTLTVPDVTATIQRTMRGRQIPASVLPSYIPQMVDELIMQRALALEAQSLGFQVTDAQVTDAIRQEIHSLFPDGKFVGTDAYAAMLGQQDLSIAQFETDLRRQLLMSRLRAVALEGVVVTNAEIQGEYRKKNDQVKVEWVKLTADKYKNEAQPSEDEVQSYFKVNSARYQIPEKKDLTYFLADPAKVEASLNPPDADLQKIYDQNKEAYRVPERVRVMHILLKTTGKPPADEPKIKAQAEDLLKQIRAGANFSDLAKKFSEDTTSAQNAKNPGELPDWVTRGQTVKEFEAAAFALKPGQVSDLVKTEYGYHIIKVLAHEDAHQRTFEEAKSDLAEQWKKQRANDIMQNVADKAQGELQKDPQHSDAVAAQYFLSVNRVNGYQPDQPLPDIGANPDFTTAIGELKVGEVSQPVAIAGNKIVLALVTGVSPARPARLDEVATQVRQTLIQNRGAAALQKHSQDLFNAAKSAGDLVKAAKAEGLEVKTSDEFNRTGSIEGLGSASYLQEAFARPDGTFLGPISVPDGTVVARVVQHIPADMSKLPEQAASIRNDVKNQKERDRESLFAEGVRDALVKQGKIKVHQDVLKRLISNYSSPS
jgi:peptidyl-prolyl cis-trans isomerase D